MVHLPKYILKVSRENRKRISVLFLIVTLLVATTNLPIGKAHAALMTTSSVQMSDSRPSATGVTYNVTFTFPSTTVIQCIQVKFGTTSALSTPATAMTSGTGFTLSGGGLTQGNWTNYGTTNGTLQIDAGTNQTPTATPATISWTGVTNTSINPAAFYAQITSYSTNTSHVCSGAVDNSNVMALVTTQGVVAQVVVDPSASLSVASYGSAVNGSGSTINATTVDATHVTFGTIAAGATSAGSQTLTASTNAAHGYSLYISDTGTMTDSNSDTFRDQTGIPTSANAFDGSTSQSSFAYTADGPGVVFGTGPTKYAGLANAKAQFAIATRSTATNADATHVEFKVMPSNTQQPGTYTTTVIYTLAPSY